VRAGRAAVCRAGRRALRRVGRAAAGQDLRRAALCAALVTPAAPAAAFAPAVEYALHCQGCHLADGRGTPGSVPALAGSVGHLARAPGGRAYMARVPGVAQAALGDAELAALLNYVVERFGGADVPPDFRPYGADEIGALRRDPLVDVDAARRALLP